LCFANTEDDLVNLSILYSSEGKCILTIEVSDFDSIPEANAKIFIWNVADSLGFSEQLISDIDGKTEITVDQGQEYNVKIFKADTFFIFKEIKIPDLNYDFTMNYTFQIKVFEGYLDIIDLDVHFASNSAEIKESDKEKLDRLYERLLNNPLTQIELASHTDSIGSDENNMRLSQSRSNSVKKYIVDKGINENRIVAKGYGEKEPKESNKSAEGRAINRRTEVRTVIKNK
tara:strand:- start:20 stop:709 length:690 start_codon:yes stop_codon:yes gene_type:complete